MCLQWKSWRHSQFLSVLLLIFIMLATLFLSCVSVCLRKACSAGYRTCFSPPILVCSCVFETLHTLPYSFNKHSPEMQHLLLIEPKAKAKYWVPISLWIAFLVFIFLMILMGKIDPSGWVHFVELYPCKTSQQLYLVHVHGAAADNATFLLWPLPTTSYIQKLVLNQ